MYVNVFVVVLLLKVPPDIAPPFSHTDPEPVKVRTTSEVVVIMCFIHTISKVGDNSSESSLVTACLDCEYRTDPATKCTLEIP